LKAEKGKPSASAGATAAPSASVAVIGTGYWGKNLVRNYAALGVLGGLYDADRPALARIAAAYPAGRPYDDVAAALTDPTLSAVAIATPAATHGALAAAALAAGKHVFVEKPLCLDVAEAETLKVQAERAGRVLMVGHLLLYHPAFRALAKVLASGALGGLRYIYANRASLGRIRREENALWSFAPHDISMILALAGRMPSSVACSGGHYLAQGVADTTLSHLDFGGDLQAHIFVSWLHPYKDHRLVVIGSEAMAVFDDVAAGPEKLRLYRHKAGWQGEVPVVDKAEAEPVPYDDAEPLRRECEAFLRAIRGEAAPPSDAGEGIRVLHVLDACQRALVSGERVRMAS
jgi:UDP-2-acetamido-3-amino-2,3-dideoxy-glucuronate N-acetyltransferase